MSQTHKHYFVLSDYGGFGICAPDIKIDDTTGKWTEVTCKNCLKKKKDKKESDDTPE